MNDAVRGKRNGGIMQYDENAEKYGYEGEMTPLKCDKLTAYKGDIYIPVYGTIADAEVYLKKDADTAIAELKDVIHELQVDLEGAKATAYAESVDAGMENRMLKRALWLARAWAASNKYQMFCFSDHIGDLMNIHGFIQRYQGCSNMKNAKEWQQIWERVECKCRAKAEEYK